MFFVAQMSPWVV
uniref:Uncharacterized protein n=1 Tax=Oryza punctata TaxID=4537 RepID=A0A0E0MHJ8_ORYPU